MAAAQPSGLQPAVKARRGSMAWVVQWKDNRPWIGRWESNSPPRPLFLLCPPPARRVISPHLRLGGSTSEMRKHGLKHTLKRPANASLISWRAP